MLPTMVGGAWNGVVETQAPRIPTVVKGRRQPEQYEKDGFAFEILLPDKATEWPMPAEPVYPKPAELFVFTAIRSARWPRRFSPDFTATLRLRPIGCPGPLLAPFGAPRRAPAEKAVDVGVVLLALRQKRQLPRALLTGTHQRRTFHRRGLPARFRRVVSRAYWIIGWSTGRQTTLRENGHNGPPPSGALLLHFGMLHTLEEAKLLSSENRKIEKSLVGSSGASSTGTRKSIPKH